ncbi:RHS repeat-associated core domain-containing protein [Grimontia sp. NTOU-MAR1]|uniref:RHS repeat-associated core domain-containing protein n=1 Tax=Grimontia sp. NTOU-MAR1 TaxID=3111011 RepID=UPI002DBF11B8|nr:RHS repeat-associated core domain-containing protein [Grimontia sp. NTOU-MAR1]WRV97974.1 RHS repeat-associated core domain-containing protein [Grimontia sp. NTOU-MAR1]
MDICSSAVGTSKNTSIASKWLTGVFTALTIFSLPTPTLALTPSGGETAVLSGDFSVSGGEATYSLPISVSPGRAGHQPQLSLQYRSDGPNGYLGMGWSVGGLSAITRCGKNLATDGRWGGVQFNANDRYCLDGKRLIAITGKDGGNLTEYRLKENGYSKVISYGAAGSGPAFFKVWTKDGSVYEYGATEDSQAQLPGQAHVYKWALNKITDITGNNDIDFKYAEQQSGSSHKIVSIDYVGGKVLFTYGDRNDKTSSYLYGSKLERSERITNLTIKNSNNQDISNYTINYVYSPGTKRSLIDNIKYCSGSQCATPISFDWYSKKAINYSVQHSDLIEPKYIDTKRDGRPSSYGIVSRTLVDHCNSYVTHKIKHPNGSTISGGHGKTYSLTGSLLEPTLVTTKWKQIGNLCDGDTYGRGANKAVLTPKGLCLGGSYSPNGDGNLNAYCENTHSAGDFNGDGKETLSSAYKLLYTGGKLRKVVAKSLDINGDGIDDLHYGVSLGKLRYKITGESTEREVEVASPSGIYINTQLSFIDINNDSLPDVVSYNPSNNQTRIYVNTSREFNLSQTFTIGVKESKSGKLDFIDINGDGYPEYFREGKFYINEFGLINANKTAETTINHSLSALLSSSSYISYPDINGDGWPDIVTTYSFANSDDVNLPSFEIFGSHGEGGSDTTSEPRDTTPYAIEHLSDGGIQDKIFKIQEAGVDYNISYKFAADISVHKQVRYYQYPYLNTTPRRFLVSGYSKSPEGYSPTTYSYVYEGARSHYKGYGFLGFNKITRTENAAIKTVTTTTYEVNDGIKAGKPLSIIETRNDKKVSEQSFDYQLVTKQGYGAKYYQIYANTITTQAFDLASPADNPVVKRKEVTTRTLDHFGNVLNETNTITSGIDGGGHFYTSTANQYLSTGVNSNHQIYDISSVQNIENFEATLSTFKAGLGRYCGTDGKLYFKPNDHIVIIHGEVDTPIVLQRYNSYYRYDASGSSTDLDGLTTVTGNLVGITAAQFNAASPTSCGSYVYSDIDGDGKSEFGTTTSSRTELVSETAENYWKIGALNVSTTVIEDKTTNDKRAVENSFEYNDDKLLMSNTTRASEYGTSDAISSAKSLTNSFKYDDYGNVTETKVTGTGITHPRMSTTAYDANGLFPTSQSNAKGHTTSLAYYPNGLMKQSVSPLAGRTMGYAYDAFQRLKSETRPGTSNVIKHVYKLGDACTAATAQTVSCVETSAPDRGKSITHFDYAGREIRSLHQGFNGEWIVQDNTWDKSGRKVSATRPRFLTDNAVSIVNFKYDELHREIEKDEPAATAGQRAVFKTQYTGFVTELTDARTYQHSTTQNVLGHILRKDEPDGAYQTYTYYPDGKLKDTTDSSGNVTTIGYDSLGHRKSLDDPDMGVWGYTYNALGELSEKTDANGVKTTLSYDALGRKTSERSDKNNQVNLMSWEYDGNGKPGTLTTVGGNGLTTDYYYNNNGLLSEVAKKTLGEKFSSHYFYDDYERVNQEVRPNGIDTSPLSRPNALNRGDKPEDRLVLQYIYNSNGYMSAVRSPKNYADEVFTSASFRAEIKQLLDQAIALANTYLERAEKYAAQESFFKGKAAEYNQKTVNVHTLDSSSAAMLAGGYRFKQWCNANKVCYLRPGTWVMLHDDVVTPIDVTLDGDIYRIESTLESSTAGKRNYTTTVHKVSEAEFNSAALTAAHDFILTDYDKNGQPDLMSTKDIYVAQADSETQEELLFSAEDLEQAGVIAGNRYKFYTELATALISLSEDVAEFSGIYCEMANQLGGDLTTAQRQKCTNNLDDQQYKEDSQAEQLDTILTQSKMEEGADAYIYYWQRRETDAWNHTLSEMLGNGLVNTYKHNARTGRPDHITTHIASGLFDQRIKKSSAQLLRHIEYTYDNHDNVKMRYDRILGIQDTFEYDGLDRVTRNHVTLDSLDDYLGATPDFAGLHTVQYDKLGNIKQRSEIGDYTYSGVQAGPHAVTQANGLTYQYDEVGNMVSAKAVAGTDNALERELEWNEFNKPTKITRNGKTVEFKYDANHSRYLKTNSDGVETFYFDKVYERVKDTTTGNVEHKHFVYADGKLISLVVHERDSAQKLLNKKTQYLHYDALESVDMITDGYGVISANGIEERFARDRLVVERRSYSVWGKQREIIWNANKSPTLVETAVSTNRGYTGHEQIEEVGLTHMNGRVYDEELGRFISADPIVQAPFVTNSFNRYAYVWNNPLKYVDPTGFVAYSERAKDRSDNLDKSLNEYEKNHSNGGTKRDGQRDSKNDDTGDSSTSSLEDGSGDGSSDSQENEDLYAYSGFSQLGEISNLQPDLEFKDVITGEFGASYGKGNFETKTDFNSVSTAVNVTAGDFKVDTKVAEIKASGSYNHTTGEFEGEVAIEKKIGPKGANVAAGAAINTEGQLSVKGSGSLGQATVEGTIKVDGGNFIDNAKEFTNSVENFLGDVERHLNHFEIKR